MAGSFDEIRLWNLRRSTAQIQEAMRRPLFGNESGLVGYWRFDEANGTTAADATGHGASAGLSNGPARVPSAIVPFAPPVRTRGATPTSPTSVTLDGWVDGRTSETVFETYFQWGVTDSLGNEQRAGFMVSPGAAPQDFSIALDGLAPGTDYYFRTVAVNGNGPSYGATATFTAGVPFLRNPMLPADTNVLQCRGPLTLVSMPDGHRRFRFSGFAMARRYPALPTPPIPEPISAHRLRAHTL